MSPNSSPVTLGFVLQECRGMLRQERVSVGGKGIEGEIDFPSNSPIRLAGDPKVRGEEALGTCLRCQHLPPSQGTPSPTGAGPHRCPRLRELQRQRRPGGSLQTPTTPAPCPLSNHNPDSIQSFWGLHNCRPEVGQSRVQIPSQPLTGCS